MAKTTQRSIALKLLRGRTPEELRYAFRLLDAVRELARAEDDMNAKRERHLCDRRDEIAARMWLNACGVFMVANEKYEWLCEEMRLSEKLAKELTS